MSRAHLDASVLDLRTVILGVLLAGYASTLAGVRGSADVRDFDALQPLGRQVETAIEMGRFGEALPVTLDLRKAHPEDLTILYWLGEVYRGLGDAPAEAAAWQQYVRLSSTPAEACPALPRALTSIGDAPGALQAYQSCVGWVPDDPERLVDLAAEYERRGQIDLARMTYQRVLTMDPGDTRIAQRMAALADAGVK